MRCLAIGLLSLIVVAGCGTGPKPKTQAARGGAGLISLNGTIGAVTLDVSTEAEVTAAVGAPEATASDSFQFPGAPEYKALGYGCTMTNARLGRALTYDGSAGPYCDTVYYINLPAGVLGSFWTTSRAFRTAHGTRVGTPAEVATRQERRPPPQNGCLIGWTETSKRLTLVLNLVGYRERRLHPGSNDHSATPAGGRVGDFAEDGRRHGLGLLFC